MRAVVAAVAFVARSYHVNLGRHPVAFQRRAHQLRLKQISIWTNSWERKKVLKTDETK
jgi:hypothetical protein